MRTFPNLFYFLGRRRKSLYTRALRGPDVAARIKLQGVLECCIAEYDGRSGGKILLQSQFIQHKYYRGCSGFDSGALWRDSGFLTTLQSTCYKLMFVVKPKAVERKYELNTAVILKLNVTGKRQLTRSVLHLLFIPLPPTSPCNLMLHHPTVSILKYEERIAGYISGTTVINYHLLLQF